MGKKFQVLGNSLPVNLTDGLEPTVYNLELKLRDDAVEYGDSSLPPDEVHNMIEQMRKNALDKAIQLYDEELTSDYVNNTKIKDIRSLQNSCTGVMIASEPEIKPKTLWLTDFNVKNDTLHYGYKAVSGSNQVPKGSVNIEFIGYSLISK